MRRRVSPPLSSATTPRPTTLRVVRWVRAVRSYKRFDVVGYSVAAITRFQQLKALKLGVGGNDLRIAAIALEAGATVVTKNRVDFSRVPGLALVDWSA